MLKKIAVATATAAMIASPVAFGEGFEVFKDYVPSKEIYNVTLIRVKPNRMDDYLAGLKQTWVNSCELSKKLGDILECSVLVSNTPANPDYNVLLLTKTPSGALSDPDEARFKKFDEEFRKQLAEDKQDQIVEGYDEMRAFFGEQDFRRIDFK